MSGSLRRSFPFLVLALTLILGSLSAAPQGQTAATPRATRATIAGSVVDGSLVPLSGAAIVLESGGKTVATTTSDSAGKFRFADIPAGTYRVRATLAGFPEFSRDVRVPSGVQMVQLPIVLTRPGDAAKDAREEAVFRQSTINASPVAAPAPMPPPPPASATGGVAAGQAGGGGGGGRGGAGAGRGGMVDAVSAIPEPRPGEWSSERVYRSDPSWPGYRPNPSGERYAHVDPNRFHSTRDEPLSTFGADVDTASYSNVRRFLSSGQLPPADAVRVEEFVNYFRFPYAGPSGNQPIALATEVADCPWAPTHKLVLIGARARASAAREIEGRNIVLLIDVSGSMAPPERLPMIKTALGMFVDTLQPDDRLAIVTYAGFSGLALPSTPARERGVIQRAIAGLNAGGSTNGGQGLILAYRTARQQFIPGGVNRVILATDGDFNVGIVSQNDLFGLIERERESGVFLSVFGVGSGNLKDQTMEMLADKGNGHYAYLDSLQEARRVLVREANATLETVAKDVKFQVEFNPGMVAAWKQIGYENRVLAAQDFNNDRKDGGEMGAGHTVTALYEIVPVGVQTPERPDDDRGDRPSVDPLRYQSQAPPAETARPRIDPAHAGEWLTVKVRYKAPESDRSDVISQPVRAGGRVQYLPLAAAIAEFGLLLRDRVHDTERWEALDRRLDRITAPASLAAETRELGELVAIGRGLARLR